MEKSILWKIRKSIEEAVKEGIPKALENKEFEQAQRECGLVSGLLRTYWGDEFIFQDEMGGVASDYREILEVIEVVARGKANETNANLVFKLLSTLYEGVYPLPE